MKITVLGAGAVGSMLGGLIKHHAPESDGVLIVRGAHGQALLDQGGEIELEGPWGRRLAVVRVCADPAAAADSDFVLVTVKSQDTEAALRTAASHLGSAVVVSIQNGINDEAYARWLPKDRFVMGMTATNMAILRPGSVRLQLNGTTVVGPSADRANAAAARQAAELLRKTGLPVHEHANVLGVRYSKLAVNALGYASCISQSNFITEGVCDRPWRQAVGLPLVEECIRTFEKAGIVLAKIPGRPDPRSLRRFLYLLSTPLVGQVVSRVAQRIYNRNPIVFSLYQDLLRGKPTEVEHINGHVVTLASSAGSSAPFNALVVELVHVLERRGPASFLTREAVVERFREAASQSLQGCSP